jgi:hypothetical protein
VKSIFDYLDLSKSYPLKRRDKLIQQYLYDQDGSVVYETILEFWMMRELLYNPIGLLQTLNIPETETIEWFANQVLFGIGGEKSDVLVLMRNKEGLRCRAVVIELKKDTIDRHACEQIKKYSCWIAQLVPLQSKVTNPFNITPVVVGFRTMRNLQKFSNYSFRIPYSYPLNVVMQPLSIYRYAVEPSQNRIVLIPV